MIGETNEISIAGALNTKHEDDGDRGSPQNSHKSSSPSQQAARASELTLRSTGDDAEAGGGTLNGTGASTKRGRQATDE